MPNYCIHLVLRLVSSQLAASEKVISHTGHWDLFVFHFNFNFFCLDQDPDPHSKPKCRSSLKCRLAKCCYFWLLAKGFYPEVTGADSRPFRCQQLTAPMGNCMNYNKLTPTGIHGTHEILETVWKFRFFFVFLSAVPTRCTSRCLKEYPRHKRASKVCTVHILNLSQMQSHIAIELCTANQPVEDR